MDKPSNHWIDRTLSAELFRLDVQMKTINNTELLNMSLAPIKRALSRFFIRVQIKANEKHMDHLASNIDNDQRALSVLAKERMQLINKYRSL